MSLLSIKVTREYVRVYLFIFSAPFSLFSSVGKKIANWHQRMGGGHHTWSKSNYYLKTEVEKDTGSKAESSSSWGSMAASASTNFIYLSCAPLEPFLHFTSSKLCFKFTTFLSSNHCYASTLTRNINRRGTPHCLIPLTCRASRRSAGLDYGEGVSLGTMKLPLDTDITTFKQLLFLVLRLSCSYWYS